MIGDVLHISPEKCVIVNGSYDIKDQIKTLLKNEAYAEVFTRIHYREIVYFMPTMHIVFHSRIIIFCLNITSRSYAHICTLCIPQQKKKKIQIQTLKICSSLKKQSTVFVNKWINNKKEVSHHWPMFILQDQTFLHMGEFVSFLLYYAFPCVQSLSYISLMQTFSCLSECLSFCWCTAFWKTSLIPAALWVRCCPVMLTLPRNTANP